MRNVVFRDPFLTPAHRVFTYVALAVLFNVFGWRLAVARAETAALDRAASRAASVVHRVEIATAHEDEIALLPGVGPTRAREFVKMRARGFIPTSLWDMRAVAGFGKGTVERIAPNILFTKTARSPP